VAEARRVLLVHSSAGHYGADRQLQLLARTLDPARWHALALLPFEGPLARELRSDGVEVLTGPLPVLRREHLSPIGLWRLGRTISRRRRDLRRLLEAQRIDVVHANTSVLLGLRRVAPRLVVHVREIYPRTPVLWPLHRRGILRADRVLCVSEAVRAALGGGEVVPDGLAVDPRRAGRAEARMALGLPHDAFVVAVLGRISGWKGQGVLVEALQPGMVGLVAGDAWPGQEHWERRLRAAIETTGADVRLLGFRDDVETIYGAADVIAVPSTAPDPLPNSALEAAAAGCCVVAADHGGLPEIIRDGETGRLVAPGDAAALGRVLEELRADPQQRERLGAAAAADVRARFAPERLAARVMDAYDDVVGR
jgi:glycosyltransferase involved in cell wall biosynthesis